MKTYRFFPVLATIVSLFLLPACKAQTAVSNQTDIVSVDIERLPDSVESYLYVGDYHFTAFRSAYGSKILRTVVDTAMFNRGTNTFCINGKAIDGAKKGPLENVQVLVGVIKPIDTLQPRPDKGDATPVKHRIYVVEPEYEYAADAQGGFDICAEIKPDSYLIIVSKGDLFRLYHVGKLVTEPKGVGKE